MTYPLIAVPEPTPTAHFTAAMLERMANGTLRVGDLPMEVVVNLAVTYPKPTTRRFTPPPEVRDSHERPHFF